MRALALDLGAQLFFHLSITEPAAGVDECSNCGIAPQLHCREQILDLPRPRDEALGRESFRVGHEYGRRETVTARVTRKSDPPPAARSDATRGRLPSKRRRPDDFPAMPPIRGSDVLRRKRLIGALQPLRLLEKTSRPGRGIEEQHSRRLGPSFSTHER